MENALFLFVRGDYHQIYARCVRRRNLQFVRLAPVWHNARFGSIDTTSRHVGVLLSCTALSATWRTLFAVGSSCHLAVLLAALDQNLQQELNHLQL